MFEEYYGVRFDIEDSADCTELIRILESNGYKCRLHMNTERITGSKRSVSVIIPKQEE